MLLTSSSYCLVRIGDVSAGAIVNNLPVPNCLEVLATTDHMQQIQASYQTLSDPATRGRYDSRNSSRTSTASGGSRHSSREDRGYDSADEFDPDLNGWSYSRPGGGGSGYGNFSGFASFAGFDDFIDFARRHFYDDYDRNGPGWEAERRREERLAREAAARQEREKELRELREQEEARRKEKEEAEAKKKAMKEFDRKFKEEEQIKSDNKRKVELARQQRIWAAHNAATTEKQQRFCDHADFWDKVQCENKGEKIKCGNCTKRRGMTGFECPHCELIVCQVCLNTLTNKRKKAGLYGKS
jgi:hypothetical protein